ncbi:MAG: aldehyde ferredoxin oxidoreductase, partial [Coriobacteriales bacterium]|nr:aldehyde ferredoxin oxidoreductase [Coriobacteriales bacterium]
MAGDRSFGWAGRILRVNLTTGAITTEPTEPYKGYIGGMGIANKIMYDEVPAGTKPFDEANKVVFAVGPLTASGVPLAGRTTIGSLSTFSKDYLVVDAHCGGMIGALIKRSGHDAVIIEGKSEVPVYININDDEVTIKDASMVWGLGTRATTETLTRLEGTDACVAAIGPAGENLLPYSCIISSRNHSAGAGTGAVLGSKKLKALVVRGSKPVNVADPQALEELSDYMLREIIGSNNNHAVPSTQQSWAEYYDEATRWTARKGLYWGAAEGGPVETGEPKPGELNTVGYRCMKSTFDLGPAAEKYTVKMGGCHSCPIHCHSDLYVERTGEIGGFATAGNTCVANNPATRIVRDMGIKFEPEEGILWDTLTGTLIDDLGLWCNYGQLYADIAHCITKGVFEKNLPPEEFAELKVERFAEKDPSVIVDMFRKLAQNDSEFAHLAWGPYDWCVRWNDQKWFDDSHSHLINYRGWPVHHAIECYGQVGGVCNMMFNRDDMIHSAVNLQGCGLPQEIKEAIGAELWGPGAVDKPKFYTPMNEAKARFAWWAIITDVLHDSLTLCNWVWPMTMSPTKARDYRGDLDLEAKFYTAVTGEQISTAELYKRAAKVMTLQRCNTMRGMGTRDLRNEHDKITEWVFTKDPDIPVFSEGTDKLDREDFQLALTMTYREFKWDEQNGCPSAESLDYYGGME